MDRANVIKDDGSDIAMRSERFSSCTVGTEGEHRRRNDGIMLARQFGRILV